MCRNIRTLFNFEPPATDDEIRAASVQFVRKVSGFNVPSKTNEATFDQAVAEVSRTAGVRSESCSAASQRRYSTTLPGATRASCSVSPARKQRPGSEGTWPHAAPPGATSTKSASGRVRGSGRWGRADSRAGASPGGANGSRGALRSGRGPNGLSCRFGR